MSADTPDGPTDASTVDTDRTNSIVAQFNEAWRQGSMPSISDFVVSPPACTPEFRRVLLLELIKADIANRWYFARRSSKHGSTPATHTGGSTASAHPRPAVFLIEEYLDQWPELGSIADVPLDLVVHEYQSRRRFGDRPQLADYELRFSAHSQVVRDTLEDVARQTVTPIPPTLSPHSTRRPSSTSTSSDEQPKTQVDNELQRHRTTAVSDTTVDSEDAGPRSPSRASISLPFQFGNYELLSEIAHGAMGVVYKSQQLHPERIVALKMIRAGEFASKDEVRRFHAEAQMAGVLQHPNIVRIIESGEHNSRHFIAMEYIDGPSLSDLVREQLLDNVTAAGFMKTVAEAVEYAHTQDPPVVHRDLKPSNVLVDASGQPHITDFGIAKRIEDGDAGDTQPGSVMGTPSYMPPEQAQGLTEWIGPWSDVYGLGAILYHVLTGRPPFSAPTVLDTLFQVVNNEPVPPSVLNPDVDPDLEAVCLKCLEKDPRSRLGSAYELAEEMDRVLRSEPTLTRPISMWTRVWKWCRRNSVVAMLSLIIVVILVTTSGVMTRLYLQVEQKNSDLIEASGTLETLRGHLGELREQKTQVEKAKQRAETERERAENDRKKIQTELADLQNEKMEVERDKQEAQQDLKKTQKDLEATRISENLAKQSAAKAKQESAIAQQESMLAKQESAAARQESEQFRESARKALRSVLAYLVDKDLTNVPGIDEKRRTVAENARKVYDELLQEHGHQDVQIQKEAGEARRLLGTIYQMLGDHESAEAQFSSAVGIFEGLRAHEMASHPELLVDLLMSYKDFANLLIDRGQLNEADGKYALAIATGQQLVNESANAPNAGEYYLELARAFKDQHRLFTNRERLEQAKEALNDCLRYLDEGVPHVNASNEELSRRYERERAVCYYNLGNVLLKLNQRDDSIQEFNKAIEILEELRSKSEDRDVLEQLAAVHNNRANTLISQTNYDNAQADLKQAMSAFTTLTQWYPSAVRYEEELDVARIVSATVLLNTGEFDEAEELSRAACDSLETLFANHKKPAHLLNCAKAYYNLGLSYVIRTPGDPTRGCQALRQAVQKLKQLQVNSPQYEKAEVEKYLGLVEKDRKTHCR